MKTQTLKQKHRMMLLVLPILVLPFVTFAFWALDGGKGNATAETTNEKGLNLQLPDAHNAAGPMDKMSYYDLATADSLKLKEQIKNDPYYRGQQQADEKRKADSMNGLSMGPSQPYPDNFTNGNSYRDPNEARVYEKLGQLNKVMQQPQQATPYQGYNAPYQSPQASMNTADVDRLEKMMQMMQNHDTGDDPETKQLSGMLERILDIQHPERVKEKIRQSEDQRTGQVYAVKTATKNGRISLIDNSAEKIKQSESDNSCFFGLNDTITDDDEQNAIEAVVHENQTLVSGSIVKLRLLDDINVRGKVIPKDNFVYGTVSLDGERLTVKINSLRYRKSLYPVKLSVYDIDGLDGIYIPGAIARDVAKSSADRSIQSVGLTSFDQTLGAQAAGAGIEAAKSFLSKKIKLIKVMVKAGYKVLLRDDKQKEQ